LLEQHAVHKAIHNTGITMLKPVTSAAENAQYPPIEEYMQTEWGCDSHTWRVGKKPRVTLEIGEPNRRVPDVVGARRTAAGWETLIAEAKNPVAHGVQQALAQLDAVAAWADYLFLSLRADDWHAPKRLAASRDEILSAIERRGYGLLLVDGVDVQCLKRPIKNASASRARRAALLEQLGVDEDDGERVIGTRVAGPDLVQVARQLGMTDQYLWDIETQWNEKFPGKNRRADYTRLVTAYRDDPPCVLLSLASLERNLKLLPDSCVDVEGDPFGQYIGDGVPALWVWVTTSAFRSIDGDLKQFWRNWYYYAENDETHRLARLENLDLAAFRAAGLTTEVCVGRPVVLWNRTRQGVLDEVGEVADLVLRPAMQKAILRSASDRPGRGRSRARK
jgi:hypothetical protein